MVRLISIKGIFITRIAARDYSEEALEADPKRKHKVISSVKEDFINRHLISNSIHDVEKLPVNISIKYNIPLSIAQEVIGQIITDPRSAIEPGFIVDTVFVYRKKEEK